MLLLLDVISIDTDADTETDTHTDTNTDTDTRTGSKVHIYQNVCEFLCLSKLYYPEESIYCLCISKYCVIEKIFLKTAQ